MSIERGQSMQDYLDSPAIGSGQLSFVHDGGARAWKARHLDRDGFAKHKQTKAQNFGIALDLIVDEGESAYTDRTHVRPEEFRNGVSKGAKADKRAAEEAGLIYLLPSEDRDIKYCYAAIRSDAVICDALDSSDRQVTLYWDCPGLPGLKSRPDFLCIPKSGVPFSVDLKSTIAFNAFGTNAIAKYRYHAQAAMVRSALRAHGHPVSNHYLLAAEKKFPNRAQLHRLTGDFLDIGAEFISQQCATLARWMRDDRWPAVETSMVEAMPPSWLSNDNFVPESEEVDA